MTRTRVLNPRPQDDLGNTDRSAFADAKNFRTFCPVDRLPSVRSLYRAVRGWLQRALHIERPPLRGGLYPAREGCSHR